MSDILSRYVSEHQAQVDAARAVQMEAVRAYSQVAFDRSADAAARVARGLVSVSTKFPDASGVGEIVTIDRSEARVKRLRKAVSLGAKAIHNVCGAYQRNVVMVTLTYAGTNEDWRPQHVRDYINRVRKWLDRRGGGKLRYVWVAELQKRGVIHYHVLVWLPKGLTMPKADKQGWWCHGMTNTVRAKRPVAYILKYASKADASTIGGFPRGARIHGCGGLDSAGVACKRWVLWPAYVQGNASVTDRFRPARGGGYLNRDTGELLRSEFMPTGGGFKNFVRIRTTPRRIDASGPFSWVPQSHSVH